MLYAPTVRLSRGVCASNLFHGCEELHRLHAELARAVVHRRVPSLPSSATPERVGLFARHVMLPVQCFHRIFVCGGSYSRFLPLADSHCRRLRSKTAWWRRFHFPDAPRPG